MVRGIVSSVVTRHLASRARGSDLVDLCLTSLGGDEGQTTCRGRSALERVDQRAHSFLMAHRAHMLRSTPPELQPVKPPRILIEDLSCRVDGDNSNFCLALDSVERP